MTPGIHDNLSADEYHSSAAISNSGLGIILDRSPAHYKAWLSEPREPTPAMVEGTIAHTAILEPDSFESTYVVAPKWDLRKNADKAAKAIWEATHKGKTPLPQHQRDRFLRMRDAVHAHPEANALLTGGKAERSVFANDPQTGVLCRVRPDYHQTERAHNLIDLKSTADAKLEEFQWSAYRYGYHRQAAFYLDTVDWLGTLRRPDDFFFIAFEKEPPYAVAVMRADRRFINRGRDAYRSALNIYAECLAAGQWPAYGNGIQTLDLPEAIHRRLDMADNDDIVSIDYVR